MRIILSANTTWYLWNFRRNLIRRLLADGYEVTILSPKDSESPNLENLGCRLIDLPISGHGKNVFKEIVLVIKYLVIFRRQKPDAFLGFTVKPVLYGGIVARVCRIASVLTITGLGTIFIQENRTTKLVEILYRLALRKARVVLFQNHDDLAVFVNRALVAQKITSVVPGSGVDLKYFPFTPKNDSSQTGGIKFLMASRLLRDKGVFEYVSAATITRLIFPETKFLLAGPIDVGNPNAVLEEQVIEWGQAGVIKYLGNIDNIIPLIQEVDCIVLPSYREGLSRILLEASAIGRPVIATATAGCREVIDEGVNGFTCCLRDPEDLARKIQELIQLPVAVRKQMGLQGRKKMEREFDEEIVINRYIVELKKILD